MPNKKIPGTYLGSNIDAVTGRNLISDDAFMETGTNKQGIPYVSLIALGDEAATVLGGKISIPKNEKRTNAALLAKLQDVPTDPDGFYTQKGKTFVIDGNGNGKRDTFMAFSKIYNDWLAETP